jgi:hypothetical protein
MSIRDQERRQESVERRIDRRMRAADKYVLGNILARQKEADRRAEEVIERIERGGVDPRPLPGLRENSMASMESMTSTESSPSTPSLESAETVSGATGEAEPAGVQENMPLQGIMPYDPASAEKDLAQSATGDTGSDGDIHLHAERKADEMARQMTDDTGADGDMNLHAERKVEQMGNEMSGS